MKKISKFSFIVALSAAVVLFSGCSDDFLKEKKMYGSFTDEIYNDYEGAKGRVNFLYACLLPYSGGSAFNFTWHSTGDSDDYSKSTEEYGGLSTYVNPNLVLNNANVPDYIYGENKNTSPYGRIRECNMVKEGIENSTLTDNQKKELLGQVYFFRAWAYYRLVKIYGGIPIIDKVQNPIIGDNGGLDLVVQRSTTKECIDFICNDLKTAAEYLPAKWDAAAINYGRVTSGAALALMGRARLLYASPLFNRADDIARWNLAYEANKAAKDLLAYDLGDPGTNASKWAKMFSDYETPEAVFVALYNNLEVAEYRKSNGWENGIRPANVYGGGGKATTGQMVDLFPMADGKKPSDGMYKKLDKSSYTYNEELFFMNRDPRFYRTFGFPGVRWTSNADLALLNASQPKVYPYAKGSEYELWSYAWYADAATRDADDQSGWKADGLGDSKSVFIRKRSDDFDINRSPLYVFDQTNKYAFSAAPYMEIRYGEVLLNFAEAACGAQHYAEAVEALKEIRKRVGYTSADNYGLETDLAGDRAKLFSAILYERQVELAYEGKRFEDMRRWMLWDGGANQESLNPSWKITGFGGNTCTYLGVEPLNGTRRTGIELRVADSRGFATKDHGSNVDPIRKAETAGDANAVRPAALDLMKDATVESESDKPIDQLGDFYRNNLKRKELRADGNLANTVKFEPKYYIIGFRTNMQANNTKLKQTIGWEDFNSGGSPGTFDPLAE